MATLLSEVDNGKTPTFYYKVEYEVKSRNIYGGKLGFTITVKYDKSQWNKASKMAFKLTKLTAQFTIPDNDFSFKIKDMGTDWDLIGTGIGSQTFTFEKWLDVSPTATSIQNNKFAVEIESAASVDYGILEEKNCQNITIPKGHNNPVLNSISYTELNNSIKNIGLQNINELWVLGLSRKSITLNITYDNNASLDYVDIEAYLFDTATNEIVSRYNTRANSNDILIQTYGSSNWVIPQDLNRTHTYEVRIAFNIVDSYGGQTGFFGAGPYNALIYRNITLNASAKRYGQTSGKVRISCNGNYFNGVLGNIDQQITNYKPTITYSYYETGHEEEASTPVAIPSSNISVSPSLSGEYTVSQFEIPNVNFNYLKSYKIVIKTTDNFTDETHSNYKTTLSIPVGEAVWSEYKDRVRFKKIQVDGEIETAKSLKIPINSNNGYGLTNTNGNSIIRDWGGAVTVDATGSDLYLGFERTNTINFLNGKSIMNSDGSIKVPNGFLSMTQGNVGTPTGGGYLILKRTNNSEAPNNGIVLEFGNSTSSVGQLYIGANADQGVYYNGWSNGVRGTWKKLAWDSDVYKIVSLYDNPSGSNASISLSETSANFTYLEIFYRTNDNYRSSKKIYSPNSKKVVLDASIISGNYTYVKTAQYSISETSITLESNLSGQARIGNSVATTWNKDSNRLYIEKVIGYRV